MFAVSYCWLGGGSSNLVWTSSNSQYHYTKIFQQYSRVLSVRAAGIQLTVVAHSVRGLKFAAISSVCTLIPEVVFRCEVLQSALTI